MRAVILAAGCGTRINGDVHGLPKALLPVGGATLIERQIQALGEAGVDEVAVVVGCRADEVRRHCGPRLTYVENARYAETNSLYSLWLARPLLADGCVVLNCDVLFHPQLLTDLLTARHEAAALVSFRHPSDPPYGDEEMKVRVSGGRVRRMSKRLGGGQADAENVGIVRFGGRAAPLLVTVLDRIVARGGLRDWAPRAFSIVARREPLWAIGTRGYPWVEVDFPEDYERAVRVILPQIEGTPDPAAGSDQTQPSLAGIGGR